MSPLRSLTTNVLPSSIWTREVVIVDALFLPALAGPVPVDERGGPGKRRWNTMRRWRSPLTARSPRNWRSWHWPCPSAIRSNKLPVHLDHRVGPAAAVGHGDVAVGDGDVPVLEP